MQCRSLPPPPERDKEQVMRHLKLTVVGLLALTAAAPDAFAFGPPGPPPGGPPMGGPPMGGGGRGLPGGGPVAGGVPGLPGGGPMAGGLPGLPGGGPMAGDLP